MESYASQTQNEYENLINKDQRYLNRDEEDSEPEYQQFPKVRRF